MSEKKSPHQYPELPAEGAVELKVILPAGLVVLDLRQRGQSFLQLLLVFAAVIELVHGICLQLLLLCPLWRATEATEAAAKIMSS